VLADIKIKGGCMMGTLRDQMLMDLQLSGAKPRTQDAYLREVENLAKYFNRSPAELGEAELKQYMLYMINERHLCEDTFRFYVAGLKFYSGNSKTGKRKGILSGFYWDFTGTSKRPKWAQMGFALRCWHNLC